ncbi:hypothetical protein E2C01_094529 [Portunus trituberculatus]|uniref:Uncharacterized protein n=1 Tax=Portunus trituberculatus TaxID=210409 RepID=A0A5B7JXE8_PORTR|nr:hypothetical protein [Portunus trituberculatus]
MCQESERGIKMVAGVTGVTGVLVAAGGRLKTAPRRAGRKGRLGVSEAVKDEPNLLVLAGFKSPFTLFAEARVSRRPIPRNYCCGLFSLTLRLVPLFPLPLSSSAASSASPPLCLAKEGSFGESPSPPTLPTLNSTPKTSRVALDTNSLA